MSPKGSTATRNQEFEWISFENEVANFSNEGETLICGDMNARTGTLPDYVQDDNNNIPEHPPLTYIVDKEHLRVSRDLLVNTQGRLLLDICISSRLRILNRRHKGDCILANTHATRQMVVVWWTM